MDYQLLPLHDWS